MVQGPPYGTTSIHRWRGSVDRSQPDLIRYCLITSATPTNDDTLFEDNLSRCQESHENDKSSAISAVRTLAAEGKPLFKTEEEAKTFLNTLRESTGGWKSVPGQNDADWDQKTYTDVVSDRLDWVIAICNDGRLWSKQPVHDALRPMEGTEGTPVMPSLLWTGDSVYGDMQE